MELQDLNPNPIKQFALWLKEAESHSGMRYPNAMTLASATKEGLPSCRVVLLRGLTEHSFLFYTNYESRKGKELNENPYCSALFFWDALKRQVRIEGKVKKLRVEESLQYFHTRPRLSQIGAHASPQSQKIPSRTWLEKRVKEQEKNFAHAIEIPLPSHWGGFALEAEKIEFWSEGENRLHDRFLFERIAAVWSAERLAP